MKKLFNDKVFLSLLIPTIFLIVGILTLGDYGINWDSPKHFMRGQAYLHFILTGYHDFLDLPALPVAKGAPDYVDYNVDIATNSAVARKSSLVNPQIRRSYFQSDFYTFDYFMTKHIHTHPEVNDLLIAITNTIFYQRLDILGDIESYHVLVILLVFVLASIIGIWTYRYFGLFSSLVAAASLVLYPLVFSESHFNIKDPVLMSFFGLAILSFWLGFSSKKAILIYLSAILAGFSLGTKFNTFFLVFILGPWAIFDMCLHFKKGKSLINLIGGKKILISLLSYPVIMFLILYIFSPYLWQNPVGNFIQIVNYYKEIGVGTPVEQSKYLVLGWNIYPLLWIFYTTPLPVLSLSVIGFCTSLFLFFKKRHEISFLILLWFVVPIFRATWPGANIYGGDRQIMEFIPAMAILAGIGANYLMTRFSKMQVFQTDFNIRYLKIVSLLLFGYLLFLPIRQYHPNENVYFNQLVGGLQGAKQKQIPSWGNSYGNVYLQGINWLNKNVEPNAKLALAENYISVIPRLKLRSDIDLSNQYWSGMEKNGEYVMEMDYDWPLRSRLKYAYLENFLDPVYQVKIDGIPILNIWKNDLEHTKKGFENEVIVQPDAISIDKEKLKIDFKKQVDLTKLVIYHGVEDCDLNLADGFVAVSEDGENFIRQPDPLYNPESPESTPGMDEYTFVHLFAGKPAVSIILNVNKPQSCILKDIQVMVWVLKH